MGLILVVEKLIHFCVTLNSLRARLKAKYFFISWLHCAGYDDPVPPSVVSLSVMVENGHVTISLVVPRCVIGGYISCEPQSGHQLFRGLRLLSHFLQANETGVILGFYAAYNDNFLPTFRVNLSHL